MAWTKAKQANHVQALPVPHFCHADQQHEGQIEMKQRRKMKRTNTNRKILLPFCMVVAMICVYFSFIYTDSHQFNHFILDNSDNWNESLPLNYFLLNEKNQRDKIFSGKNIPQKIIIYTLQRLMADYWKIFAFMTTNFIFQESIWKPINQSGLSTTRNIRIFSQNSTI